MYRASLTDACVKCIREGAQSTALAFPSICDDHAPVSYLWGTVATQQAGHSRMLKNSSAQQTEALESGNYKYTAGLICPCCYSVCVAEGGGSKVSLGSHEPGYTCLHMSSQPWFAVPSHSTPHSPQVCFPPLCMTMPASSTGETHFDDDRKCA